MRSIIWWVVVAVLLLAGPKLLDYSHQGQDTPQKSPIEVTAPDGPPQLTCDQLQQIVKIVDPNGEPGPCYIHH